MGVWIEVEEGEPIADALRRFRKLILAEGGFPLLHCKWHKKRPDLYQKPSVYHRRRRWRDDYVRPGRRAIYGPDPDYYWADDLHASPRSPWGYTDDRKRKATPLAWLIIQPTGDLET